MRRYPCIVGKCCVCGEPVQVFFDAVVEGRPETHVLVNEDQGDRHPMRTGWWSTKPRNDGFMHDFHRGCGCPHMPAR